MLLKQKKTGIGYIEMLAKLIKDNIFIFALKRNFIKTLLLVVVPIIIIAIIYAGDCLLKLGWDLKTAISLLLTVYGIFISARVLMAVNRNETTEISEYILHTIKIISESEKSNTIYIIAPTFCPGLTNKTTENLLEDLYNLMRKMKDYKNVNFIFAFLKVGSKKNPSYETVNLNNVRDDNDLHWKMYKEFYREEYNKMNDSERLSFIHEIQLKIYGDDQNVSSYYNRIKELAKDSSGSVKLFELGDQYLSSGDGKNDDIIFFSGFFATANISLGKYYLGTFNHDGIKTRFEGTAFENKYIQPEMEQFFYGLIDKKCNASQVNYNATNC